MILFIVTVAMDLFRMLLDANYRSNFGRDTLHLAAFILTLVLVTSLIVRGIANGRRWVVVLVAVLVAVTLPVMIKELAADLRNNLAWFAGGVSVASGLQCGLEITRLGAHRGKAWTDVPLVLTKQVEQ